MSGMCHLSFSVGPVQGFVAQARRTRDLWAGSWLLSYLAENALAAAEHAGGQAIIPHRPAPRTITSKQSAVGGMPNRFELRFEGTDAEDQAKKAAEAAEGSFRKAWERVADAVFDRFVEPVLPHGNGTQEIWCRQVKNFWELSWVLGSPTSESDTIGHLAAWRKNFRNVPVTEEPGTKCSLMPTLQEISGHFGRGQWEWQKHFWAELRNNLDPLDLGETERLCAIALIKRLFPKVIKEAVGDVSRDLDQVAWPSTAFMAALPWLKSLTGLAREGAERFIDEATAHGVSKSEWAASRDADIPWAALDAPAWFQAGLKNNEWGLADDQLKRLQASLAAVHEAAGGAPVPYYALLLMDGDNMGRLLRELKSPETLSQRLGRFAARVAGVVARHDGRTVYAGGDDLLALLPADKALDAAEELSSAYRQAFAGTSAQQSATISAAVVYAHWRYPLRQVLRTAHHLLDDVAKESTGRDAVAIGLVFGSGLHAVWAVPWDVFHGRAKTECNDPCVSLRAILDWFSSQPQEEADEPSFNASYLYLLRERFARLFNPSEQQPGRFAALRVEAETDTAELLRDLAHAEYRRRIKKSVRLRTDQAKTRALIDQLMSLSRRWSRSADDGTITCDRTAFTFDGWRVAQFLKQVKEGKVEEHD